MRIVEKSKQCHINQKLFLFLELDHWNQIEMKAYIGSFPKHMLDLILPFEEKKVIQPASEASGLAEGQRARFAREAATRFYPPPTPSGAVGHNPKSGSGQFLGRTSLEMHFTRVGVKSKIGHTTRVDAYVCLTLHAGRVKRVKCVKRAILGKIRE